MAKDDAHAVIWIQKAADQGYAEAQEKLGEMYARGRGGLAKDDAQAVSLFRKAAEQGFAQAQFTLGWAYDTGDGVPVDIIEGERWLRKAADQGYDLAQYVLCLKHNEFCNN